MMERIQGGPIPTNPNIHFGGNGNGLPYPQKQEKIENYVIWQADDGACKTCMENAQEGPIPYGTPFPSGDIEPPAHNFCRCVLLNSMRGSCPIHGYEGGQRIFELSDRY